MKKVDLIGVDSTQWLPEAGESMGWGGEGKVYQNF